jgi:hypothetical protein
VLTLSKGWVTRDRDGRIVYWREWPKSNPKVGLWIEGGHWRCLSGNVFTDLPVFNPDLPWTEHIVEVGGEETVGVNDDWSETNSRIVGRKIEDVIDDHVEIGPIISPYPNLNDGWVAEDRNKALYWFSVKPSTKHSWPGEWLMLSEAGSSTGEARQLTRNEVIFPDSMPWDQRIVRIVNNQIVRDE